MHTTRKEYELVVLAAGMHTAVRMKKKLLHRRFQNLSKMASDANATDSRPLSAAEVSTVLALPGNHLCADCSAPNPKWASISHGAVICLECAGAHRGLGVHLSFARSLTLDHWSEKQLAAMLAGGNDRLKEYLSDFKGAVLIDFGAGNRQGIKAKYSTPGAAQYRAYLAESSGGEPSNLKYQQRKTSGSRKLLNYSSGWRSEPPFPADNYHLAYHVLLGSKGLTLARLIPLFSGTGTLAIAFGPKVFSGKDANAVRIACAALLVIPIAAVGGLVVSLSHVLIRHRQEAFNSARNNLSESLRSGRAARKDRYDIYIPECALVRGEVNHGIIFFPGALVDHTAYSIVASRLSDAGILVAVMNLEPYRLAMSKAGVDKTNVLKAMYGVIDDGCVVKEWAIGGHGLGAEYAMNLIQELMPGMSKLVLWGIGSAPSGVVGTLKGRKADVIAFVGDNDTSFRQSSQESKEKFRSKLESTGRSEFVVIRGGNHCGCAHYGPQTWPAGDGDRTITLDEQQRILVNNTVAFLEGEPLPNAGPSRKEWKET